MLENFFRKHEPAMTPAEIQHERERASNFGALCAQLATSYGESPMTLWAEPHHGHGLKVQAQASQPQARDAGPGLQLHGRCVQEA
jgi:hypothetical protein